MLPSPSKHASMSKLQDKVIFFKSTWIWGGGESMTLILAKSLPRALLVSNFSPLLDRAKKIGLTAFRVSLGHEVARRRDIPGFLLKKPFLSARLTKRLKDWWDQGFKTVVVQSLNERLIITPIAKKIGYRVIWLELQPWTPFLVKHVWVSKLKKVSQQADLIIVNSRFAKQELVDEGLDEKKISILYPGVSGQLHTRSRKSRVVTTGHKNKLVIGTVGRLHQEKGIDVFIRALALLPSHYHGLVVGDGPAREILEGLVSQFHLDKRIRLVGFKVDPEPFYQQLDLFCQPSRRDNAPMAILEAMAWSLPVVATTVGGIPELVNGAGCLVEPENVEALAKAIETILINPKRYCKVSQVALAQAKKFTQIKMVKSFLKIIHSDIYT